MKDHQSETLETTTNILDEIGVPKDHRVRRLATSLYEETTHQASPRSFAVGLAYLATQCDSDFDEVSQREVAEISGVSKATIRKHYQEIARGIDPEEVSD